MVTERAEACHSIERGRYRRTVRVAMLSQDFSWEALQEMGS